MSKSEVREKTFEFHLMVKDWKVELVKLEKLDWNITRVLIHAPVFNSNFQPQISKFNLGLVLNPEDSVADNLSTIKLFPTVQLMTVHPGKQGSPFVPEVLEKIKELRENGYDGEVILDGAMNDKTLALVLEHDYLPDAICPGSYFKENVKNRLAALENLIRHSDPD
jgi:pentose-5-phosphate-3-epimerase